MQKWMLLVVTHPAAPAANQPFAQYAARQRLGIERLGTYMRVIGLPGSR